MLRLRKSGELHPERGLFGLMAVGDQPCDQVDQEVDGTAMARMLDLRDVFELICDGLDDGSFAQKEFV